MKKTLTYLLCDSYTSGILLVSEDPILVNCAHKGILNSYIVGVVSNKLDQQLLKFADKNVKHYYYKSEAIFELGVFNITPAFIKTKEYVQLRKPYIQLLISSINYRLITENNFILDSLSLLSSEIDKCDQLGGITDIISDMAEISEFEDKLNYLNHLKLIVNSEKNRRLRLYAIFYKYIDIFNELTSEEELNLAMKNSEMELGQNALI